MMRKIFSLFVLFSSFIVVQAQNNQKYLEGAITEVDGKVVFTRTINVNKSVGKDQLFDIMKKWVDESYAPVQDSKQRVLFSDKSDYTIACQGDMDLVFKRTALSLDKAQMWYQLIIEVQNNSCELVIKSIKYQYNESGAKPTVYPAENMITDKFALNKKKDKLNNYYNKFRIATIDSIDALFNNVDIYLNGEQTVTKRGAIEESLTTSDNPVQNAQVQPQAVPFTSAPVTVNGEIYNGYNEPSSKETYTPIQLNQVQIPLNELLQNVLISVGSVNEANIVSPLGNQVGYILDKPTFSCILSSASLFNGAMSNDGTYTITVYTNQYKNIIDNCRNNNGRSVSEVQKLGLTPFTINGNSTAFEQAKIIMECKLLMSPVKLDSGKYILYTGEILSIIVK